MAPSDAADDDELDALVAQAVEAFESGGDEAVDTFLASHGAHAPAVKARLVRLREIGLLTHQAALGEVKLEKLGEFRLIRPLGAGGMGIVYLAEQEKLGREVALKVIRPEHVYFPGARLRFRREVEIIAKLQHPGIVPIYTVGEENGIPYFAMEMLRGATLEERLRALHGRDPASLTGRDLAPDSRSPGYLYSGSWEEACLRVLRQVSDAVSHAHERSVIHRDIKPSNVFLTSDGTSRVVLLDFGLAASGTDGKLTRTGARMGSLSYMSPEQVRGDSAAIGPKSDVYGLGVTLYEMLTLSTAFGGRTETEILRAIERGAPPRIREKNPSISWETETVCLTAMEHDMARRYGSAPDLLRDLDNVLARRPIEARRVGLIRRARRWIERSPEQAAAIGLGAALLVGLPTVYAVQAHFSSVEISSQRDRAEKNLTHALDAVDRMLTRVGSIDLRFMPQMEPVRKALLEDAVALLERFISSSERDPRALAAAAGAHARLGRLLDELGRKVEAANAYEQAEKKYALLQDQGIEPENAAMRIFQAREQRALTLTAAGKVDEALSLLKETLKSIERLEATEKDDPAWIRRIRLECETTTAHALEGLGQLEDARKQFEIAAGHAEAIATKSNPSSDDMERCAHTWNEFSLFLLKHYTKEGVGNEQAEAMLRRAITAQEALASTAEDKQNIHLELSTGRINLAGALRRAARFDEASEECKKAHATLESLVERHPENLTYKLELATVCNQSGLIEEYRKSSTTAEEYYRRSVELLREITEKAPADATLLNRFAQSQVNLSSPVRMRPDGFEEAHALMQNAVETFRRAQALSPKNSEIRSGHAASIRALSTIRGQAGRYEAAAEAAEMLLSLAPDHWSNHTSAALLHANICKYIMSDAKIDEADRPNQAARYVDRAVEHLSNSFRCNPPPPPPPKGLKGLQDFRPLHGHPGFEKLAESLAKSPPKEK